MDTDEGPFTAPLETLQQQLLSELALPNLRTVSVEDYRDGFSVLWNSAAPSSVVIDDETVFVCFEWDPGCILLQIGPTSPIAAVALRDPRPTFGRREPLADDPPFDEEELTNPLYDLIFTPWDAQFDPRDRQWGGFTAASATDTEVVRRAFESLASLPAPEVTDESLSARVQHIAGWAGVGIRIPPLLLPPQ